jgi:protein SCO1/2
MQHFSKAKFLVVFIALIMPIVFYAYFEWKKYQTGFRIEELPFLSQTAVPDFAFKAHDGNTFQRAELNGKIVVADYFFTTCPGICKQMTGQMKRVEEYFSTSEKFTSDWMMLSFTVDPERDTVETLAAYAKAKGVQTAQWKFLTGNKDSLYHLAINFFKLPSIDMETDSVPEPFVHSEKLVLLDKDGFIRGYYDGTDTFSVNKLMNDALLLDIHYTLKEAKEKKKQKQAL